VSSTGVLVFRPDQFRGRPLAWYDRTGKQIAIIPDSRASFGVALAPDEHHLIVPIDDGGGSDLWMIDVDQGTRSRVTSDEKTEDNPVLSPDGRYVVFSSDRNGREDLYRKRADGVGDEQLLVKSNARKAASDWSSHWITFTAVDSVRKDDLWVLQGDGEARPYLQTEFKERAGHLSPDERWMVYVSDEAGRDAIYIRPFPNVNGGKWRVSGGGGGLAPRWRADGKEILYVDGGGQLIAVPVKLGDQSPALGVPQVLFQAGSLTRTLYAVSRDGTRFLMPVRSEGSEGEVPLTVVLNWPTRLRK